MTNKHNFTKTLEIWIFHDFLASISGTCLPNRKKTNNIRVSLLPQGYCGEGGEDSKGTHLSASGLSPAGNRYKARFPSSRATPARDLGPGDGVLIS